MIVNDISLNRFITYTNSVYDIEEKFKGLTRNNYDYKSKPSTVAKTMFASFLCGYKSINVLNEVNKNKKLDLRMLYRKREYIPRTHGIRDCITDTDCHQIEQINKSIILKAKENKVFRKNTIDGLCVMAWDGVELNETNKDISGLPEREHSDGNISKYLKYLVGMNVGERANIVVTSTQLLGTEKITTKSGNERAKTIGETKAFENVWKDTEKLIGRVIDVHVFDALFLNQNVTSLIDKTGKYFVIRLKNENRDIYKDAEGIFNKREADKEYEIVEIITTKDIKYSSNAKKKDEMKTKTKKEKRKISLAKLGEKVLVDEYVQNKKNSTVKVKVYEKVVTNMLNHDVETILKIMHLRWNIENCGFRTLKQRYNINHIYIGNLNAINYIVQMIFLVFNLLELYTKFRLKIDMDITWITIFKLFERELHSDKKLIELFNSSG